MEYAISRWMYEREIENLGLFSEYAYKSSKDNHGLWNVMWNLSTKSLKYMVVIEVLYVMQDWRSEKSLMSS